MRANTNRLRVLRAERRMTQMLLARRSRINVTRLSHIENDVLDPTDVERARLAKALGVELAEAFPLLQNEAVAS